MDRRGGGRLAAQAEQRGSVRAQDGGQVGGRPDPDLSSLCRHPLGRVDGGASSAGRILELGRSDDGLGGGGPWAKVEYQRDGYLYRSTVPVRHSLRDYKSASESA